MLKNMKTIFLCSSLEPGRDGVGDYTRRLAGQLLIRGYQTSIIALNERILKLSESNEIQIDSGQEIQVLRLSSALTWEKRVLKAKSYVDSFDPDFISLQYVPYGFQDKGLPFQLSSHLKAVSGNIKCHIMFHELWLGIRKNSSIKDKIYGHLQVNIVKNLVKTLTPCSISTSSKLYQLELKRRNIPSNILPLFSNIEILEPDYRFIDSVYSKMNLNERCNYTLIGIFGTLYRHEYLQGIIYQQHLKSNKENKKIAILFFGRIGNHTEYNRLKNIFQDQVEFVHLGELSERQISSILQILDKAISCTPFEYLEKSGVYAAFRLHNLEVLTAKSHDLPEYALEINAHNQYLKERDSHNWSACFVSGEFINLLYTHRLSHIFGSSL